MVSPRVPERTETDQGIVGEYTVSMYDLLQRNLRDRGLIQTKGVLGSGITRGHALEVGSGPGYLGLEWLKSTKGTSLTGLDISPDMIVLAQKNAREYGLEDRAHFVRGSGDKMPFERESFDAVFTNGSLHEWLDPRVTFDEIWRVLRMGGRYFVSDLRRDMPALLHWLMRLRAKPQEMRPGLESSINSSYTPAELMDLVKGTKIEGCKIGSIVVGIALQGIKR